MKALKATARENKRYLLLKGSNLRENVKKAIFDGIGVLGMSKTGLSWIKENIIAINREMLNEVRACFALFPEEIKIVRVSGSLKNLKK